jgi:hypothetical protein
MENLEDSQEDKTCYGNPGGIQEDERDEAP